MNFRIKIILILLQPILMFSQNEARFWLFGRKAGLDFSTNPPTALNSSQMIAYEGCSCISDLNGNLQFSTAGDTVWNNQNQIMANGTGLFSGYSNTQAAQIVRWPGNSSKYYLFTLSKGTYINNNSVLSDTLYYHIIDMSLAAGSGSVISKNNLLSTGCSEKMTLTKHCNGIDSWLVIHQSNSGNFLSFRITPSGLLNSPVISQSGITKNDMGQIKISPNGRKLAMANFTCSSRFSLYDFNSNNGVISNSLVLSTNTSTSVLAYGCEFSPDCSKLYGTENGLSILYSALHQWDICASGTNAIVTSIQSNTINASNKNLALQLAPNGFIYIAVPNSNSISVITSPNNTFPNSNLQQNAVSLGNNKCVWGLPGFNSTLFKANLPVYNYSVGIQPACNNFTFFAPTVNFSCNTTNYTGLSWNFNDPLSGAANTSSLNNPVHNFSSGGTYTVMLLLQTPCTTDTLRQQVVVNSPALLISGNTTVCPFQSSSFTVTGANSYTWSNNAQGNVMSFSPSVTTQYTVSGSNTLTGCVSNKTFSVIVNKCAQVMSSTENENGIALFPNPSHNELFFSTNSTDLVILVFYNQLGEEIFRESNYQNMKPIDIRALSPDLYYYRVLTNQKTYHGKFVKE